MDFFENKSGGSTVRAAAIRSIISNEGDLFLSSITAIYVEAVFTISANFSCDIPRNRRLSLILRAKICLKLVIIPPICMLINRILLTYGFLTINCMMKYNAIINCMQIYISVKKEFFMKSRHNLSVYVFFIL